MVDERAWTRGLAEFFAGVRDVPVGIGDDAAVLDFGGSRVAVTCDPVVAGVHFAPHADPVAVGRKAMLRNVSDLAAMGAEPCYAVVSVLLPTGGPSEVREGVFAGLRSAAVDCGVQVVGGDVGATPGPLTVTCTLLGSVASRVLLRAGAGVGDAVHVTGPLGGAGTGRHLEPRPRVEEGRWLASQECVRAAIDVSDGLALDLATLLEASAVAGAELDEVAIPIHDDARRASGDGKSALEHALGDGEDYELLFVVRGGELPDGGPLAESARRPIGRIVDRDGLWLRRADGSVRRLEVSGYRHDV